MAQGQNKQRKEVYAPTNSTPVFLALFHFQQTRACTSIAASAAVKSQFFRASGHLLFPPRMELLGKGASGCINKTQRSVRQIYLHASNTKSTVDSYVDTTTLLSNQPGFKMGSSCSKTFWSQEPLNILNKNGLVLTEETRNFTEVTSVGLYQRLKQILKIFIESCKKK